MMTRDEMLTRVIRIWGFEHANTIWFAQMMESAEVSDDMLLGMMICLEELPYLDDEEE